MKPAIPFLILAVFLAATAGVQGQAVQWQSSFERKALGHWPDSSSRPLAWLMAADASMTDSAFAEAQAELTIFCEQLAKKRRRFLSESHFLYYVFGQVQQRYLHHFQPYPLFVSLRLDSTYNCLTGTALYAWLLGRLGFETEIRETNLHAYLRVRTVRSTYLIDCTDPQNGFVSDDETLMARRELWYAANELRHGKAYNQPISLRQLAGLQYYNEAVKAFNRRAYAECLGALAKADLLYGGSVKVAGLRQMAEAQGQPAWTASAKKSAVR